MPITPLGEESYPEIMRKLNSQGGNLLIAEPESAFYRNEPQDARFFFLVSPHLDKTGGVYGGDSANGREYLLEPDSPSSDNRYDQAIQVLEHLKADGFRFRIGPVTIAGMNPCFSAHGVTYFFQDAKDTRTALYTSIDLMARKIREAGNGHLTSQGICSIVDYAMEDLKTGAVMNKNAQGMKTADSIYFADL
jgi:hypothetical protein